MSYSSPFTTGSTRKMYAVLPLIGVGDLRNVIPAICSLRFGLSLLPNASLYFAMTASKSAVLSGLISRMTMAASPSSVRTGFAGSFAGSCADATPAPASVSPASTIPDTNTWNPRSISQPPSTKGRYFPYRAADENRHDIVGQKHAAPRQRETPARLTFEQSSIYIR